MATACFSAVEIRVMRRDEDIIFEQTGAGVQSIMSRAEGMKDMTKITKSNFQRQSSTSSSTLKMMT